MLEWIPDEIVALRQLEKLNFANTPVRSLPVALTGMPKLTRIDAKGNEFINIPASILNEGPQANNVRRLSEYLKPTKTSPKSTFLIIGNPN